MEFKGTDNRVWTIELNESTFSIEVMASGVYGMYRSGWLSVNNVVNSRIIICDLYLKYLWSQTSVSCVNLSFGAILLRYFKRRSSCLLL